MLIELIKDLKEVKKNQKVCHQKLIKFKELGRRKIYKDEHCGEQEPTGIKVQIKEARDRIKNFAMLRKKKQ